jgi:hypothetical protein
MVVLSTTHRAIPPRRHLLRHYVDGNIASFHSVSEDARVFNRFQNQFTSKPPRSEVEGNKGKIRRIGKRSGAGNKVGRCSKSRQQTDYPVDA